MYLQGRASEISLRRDDTKQVRNVSASPCVVARLPPTSLCQPAVLPSAAWRCTALSSAHTQSMDYQMLPWFDFTVLSTFITFVCLRAEILPCARHRENIVLLIACLGSKRANQADVALRR